MFAVREALDVGARKSRHKADVGGQLSSRPQTLAGHKTEARRLSNATVYPSTVALPLRANGTSTTCINVNFQRTIRLLAELLKTLSENVSFNVIFQRYSAENHPSSRRLSSFAGPAQRR